MDCDDNIGALRCLRTSMKYTWGLVLLSCFLGASAEGTRSTHLLPGPDHWDDIPDAAYEVKRAFTVVKVHALRSYPFHCPSP